MSNIKFGLQLELKGDQVVIRGLDGTRTAVSQLEREVTGNTRASQQATRANQQLAQSFGSLQGVITTLGIGYLFREYVQLTDQYNVLDQRVKTATRSTGDYLSVAKEVYAITQDNGIALAITAGQFQSFSRSKEALGATNAEMLVLTDTVQKLGVIGGSTREELTNGLRQFSQALNSPRAQAEEMNSILDQLPEVAKRIEQGLGLLPGSLKAAVNAGNVLSKDIFRTLLEQAPEIAREFNDIPTSVDRAWASLQNSIARTLGLIDDNTDTMTALAQSIQEAASALDSLNADDLEYLGNTAIMVAAAIVARFAGPVVQAMTTASAAQLAYTASVLQGNVVTLESAAAEKARAAASLQKAQAQRAATAAELAGYNATLQSTRAELALEAQRLKAQISDKGRQLSVQRMATLRMELAAATTALTRVEAAHSTSLAAEAAAMSRYTAAANAATVSNRALAVSGRAVSGAVAMLGGPAGVAILAAAGLYAFRDELGLIPDPARDAEVAIRKVTAAIEGTDKAATQARIHALTAQLADFKAEAAASAKAWDTFDPATAMLDGMNMAQAGASAFATVTQSASVAANKVKATEEELERLHKQLADFDKPDTPELDPSEESAKAAAKALVEKTALLAQENQLLALGYSLEEARFIAAYANADELTQAYLRQQQVQHGIVAQTREQAAAEEERIRIAQRLQAELEEAAKDFVIAIGLEFDHDAIAELAEQFDGLDDIASMFDGIGSAGEAAIDKIVQATKAFTAAEAARETGTEGAWGAYAEGVAYAIQGAQQFADDGSAAYAKLGVAVSALNTVSAIQAVLNQGSGDPVTAFARMAAMAAAVASLGVQINGAFGSDGDNRDIAAERQASQGTGSVLGDAKAQSESILNSLELLSEINDDLLGVNVAMLANLQDIRNSLAGLGGLVVRRAGSLNASGGLQTGTSTASINTTLQSLHGDFTSLSGDTLGYLLNPLGLDSLNEVLDPITDALGGVLDGVFSGVADALFGKTSTKTVDTGVALLGQSIADILEDGIADGFVFSTQKITKKKLFSKKSSYKTYTDELSDELERQFGLVIGDIYDTIFGALTTIYGADSDALARLNSASIEEQKISLKGLSGEEQIEAIEAVFSKIADDLATVALPTLLAFADVGEGAFETLARISTQLSVLNTAADALGISLPSLPDDLLAISDALAEQAGGLEQFAANIASYFDFILTDAEKLERQAQALSATFGTFGETLPESRDGLAALVAGLDLTTEAGQQAFNAITANADALADYYEQLEDTASAAYDFDTWLGLEDGMEGLRNALADVGLNIDIVQTAAAQGAEGLQAVFAALSDAQRASLEPFIDALDDLVNGVDDLADAAATLRDFARSATGNLQDASQQQATTQADYQAVLAAVAGGDLTRVDELTSLGTTLIDLAATTASNELEYQRVVAGVASAAASVADILDPQTELDIATEQLSVLQDIRAELAGYDKLPGADVGGTSVDEPSAQDTAMLANLRELSEQLSALAAEQRSGHAAIATSTNKVAKLLERWDDGDALAVRETS